MDTASAQKPKWLNQWLAPQTLLADYSRGTKQYAQQLLHRFSLDLIRIDEIGFTAHLGEQHFRWRLVKEKWIPTCSCGYPEGKCLHTAMLALAFNRLAAQRDWDLPFSNVLPPTNTLKLSPTSRPLPERKMGSEYDLPSRCLPPSSADSNADLLVEADLNDVKTMVTLQFYRRIGEQKNILTLNHILGIYNLFRRSGNGHIHGWTEEACSLLRWLGNYLSGKSGIVGRQTMIRISPDEFKSWRYFWEDHAQFLLYRGTTVQPFRRKVFLRLFFDLTIENTSLRINPIFESPDGQFKASYCDIASNFNAKKTMLLIKDSIYDCQLPVSVRLLDSCFASGSRTMPLDKVEEFLPPLLEYHYELMRGTCITRTQREEPCSLHVDLIKNEIGFRITVGEKSCEILDGKLKSLITFHRINERMFEINTLVQPELQTQLNDFLAMFLKSGRKTLPATPQVFQELRTALGSLSANLTIRLAPELDNLLDEHEGEDLVPILTIREHYGHYVVKVRWKTKDNMEFSDDEIQNALMQNGLIQSSHGTWYRFNPQPYKEKRNWWGTHGIEVSEEETHLLPEELQHLLIKKEEWGEAVAKDLSNQNDDFLLDTESQKIAEYIRNLPPKEPLKLPSQFETVLRDYQRVGFDFLGRRYAGSIGAILADDMGLGKTVQTLALIAAIIEQHRESEATKGEKILIVCPASVLSVWQNEARRFTPNLRVASYVGNADARRKIFEDKQWDCLLVTYGVMRSDDVMLAQHRFALIILDEAQMIKNRRTKVSQSVRRLVADCRIALTGTPLENMVLDIWSIMDFLNPGYLGSADKYADRTPGSDEIQALKKKIEPFILRRTKQEVAKELPSRTEEVISLEMGEKQRKLYMQFQTQARQLLQRGGAKSAFNAISALIRLRQICCHPGLLGIQDIESEKVRVVLEMAEELISSGHSVLIFSQFVEMLHLVRKEVSSTIRTYELIGSTPTAERARLVREFNDESTPPALFFISLKAGGTGITLTKADYVFILDPWWNPSVERQAIDRTHRIGQDKPVIAYRFVMAHTVEEEVMKIKEEKALLFDQIMENSENSEEHLSKLSLNAEELRQIIFKDFE